jgi:hypothetical protein
MCVRGCWQLVAGAQVVDESIEAFSIVAASRDPLKVPYESAG